MTYSENIQFQIDKQLQAFEAQLGTLAPERLGQSVADKEWNAVECIEHLNLTLVHYLPQMQQGISRAIEKKLEASENFRPGFLGERMARLMRPREGVIRMPVRTFRKFNPASRNLEPQQVLDQFRSNMLELKQLAVNSQQVHLGKIRVKSAIGSLLRLKLGDTFPFLLAHNERHLLQAKRALNKTLETSSITD